MNYKDKKPDGITVKQVTTYHEKKIGKTLFRVTSVYKGEFELGKALEDLTVRKILRAENAAAGCEG
jgi:hypothetical protein